MYRHDPVSIQNGTIFPYYSNQSENRYLKIIAWHTSNSKPLSFHLSRHTFATTVTLENGMPMESVSPRLGRASICTTQIYSKVKKKKVMDEMTALRNKISIPVLKVLWLNIK